MKPTKETLRRDLRKLIETEEQTELISISTEQQPYWVDHHGSPRVGHNVIHKITFNPNENRLEGIMPFKNGYYEVYYSEKLKLWIDQDNN